jgi:hypothetical protein
MHSLIWCTFVSLCLGGDSFFFGGSPDLQSVCDTSRLLFLRLLKWRRFVGTVVAPKQDLDFAFCFVQALLALAR